MDQIANVQAFLSACDQSTVQYNPRQLGLYTGLQIEELAEKLEIIWGDQNPTVRGLHNLADQFKRGEFDPSFNGLNLAEKADLLDADMDLAWVSFGAAFSLGARVHMAWALLNSNNMAKLDPVTGKARRHPETGKVLKPVNHTPPDFESCF